MTTMQLAETGIDCLAIFGLPGGGEWIVLLILGLLIFGRRLPEVGKSIGRSIVEFKKGIRDIETDVDDASSRPRESLTDRSQEKSEIPSARVGEESSNPYQPAEKSAGER
jgi:sec-independent protein translocase protein TatA